MFTFADENVALEVHSVALRELEHGVQLRLRSPAQLVVHEVRQNVRVGTAKYTHVFNVLKS